MIQILPVPKALDDLKERFDFTFLGDFADCKVGVAYVEGETEWERHPGGDEIVMPLDGPLGLKLKDESDPETIVEKSLAMGEACIIPPNVWHKQIADGFVKLLFVTHVESSIYQESR